MLSWLLLKHLPAKDEQIEKLLDRHEKQLQAQHVAHKDALETVTEHCEKEVSAMVGTFKEEIKGLSASFDNLAAAVGKAHPEVVGRPAR